METRIEIFLRHKEFDSVQMAAFTSLYFYSYSLTYRNVEDKDLEALKSAIEDFETTVSLCELENANEEGIAATNLML